MVKKFSVICLAAILLVIIPQYAMAFELVEAHDEPGTFGIGYEFSLDYQPVATVAYNLNTNIEVQGIIGIPYYYSYTIGFFGVNFLYGGKLIYRLMGKPAQDLYIFGLLGGFSRNDAIALGGAAGIGVESSYINIPNLACFGELGYANFGFPDTSTVLMNYGLRLYF